MRTNYATLVLSDIHIGSDHSRTEEVTRFLKQVTCDRLILNGDIIDGWQLKKQRKKWKPLHTEFFKVLMKMMEQNGTEIIYVRGNHDDFLDHLAPMRLYNISVVKDYQFHSHGKRYYVTHGDVFDRVTTHMRWLALVGDWGYTFLLWGNRVYNKRREKQGKPYYSLSQRIKNRVKSAVSYISDFEKELVALAKNKKADAIICCHIHQAADKTIAGVRYLNSGDWVESLTALAQDQEGEWKIIQYNSMPDLSTNKMLRDTILYAAIG